MPCSPRADPQSWSLGAPGLPQSPVASAGHPSALEAPPEPHGEPPALVGEAAAFHTRAHSGFPEPAQERELNLWAGCTGWLDGWAFQKRRAAGHRSGRLLCLHPGERRGGLRRLCRQHLGKWLPGSCVRALVSPARRAGLLRKAPRLRLWGGPGSAPHRRLPENGCLGLAGRGRSASLPGMRALIARPAASRPWVSCLRLEGSPGVPAVALLPHLLSEAPGICVRRGTRAPVASGNWALGSLGRRGGCAGAPPACIPPGAGRPAQGRGSAAGDLQPGPGTPSWWDHHPLWSRPVPTLEWREPVRVAGCSPGSGPESPSYPAVFSFLPGPVGRASESAFPTPSPRVRSFSTMRLAGLQVCLRCRDPSPPGYISIVLGGACASRLASLRPHLGLPVEWKLCASSPAHR
ncbi:collagen alpha-1(I) chain-like [Ailuropoda melanoleuca]|uniref:collagen alpha-1(I) chain-like n=1 Tax=Ailuropoda melanoleuca TaxID=9646 RepID=UPI0014945B67|nr:collagen alpha-1(I) chain-like [Ailuropoda melanoleuca]